jgi:integrase
MPDGTEPWVLHDLRRTFASGCAKLGIAIHVVEKCLGHASGTFRGIVSVYQRHDFAAEQRAAVETWSRHVAQIVSGETANVFPMLRAAT